MGVIQLLPRGFTVSARHRGGTAMPSEHKDTPSAATTASTAIKLGITYHSHVNRGSITSGNKPAVRAHSCSLDSLTLPGRPHCLPENRDKNQKCDAFELVSLGKYSVCEQKSLTEMVT